MKISELSTQTGVPVATLKYYLREGLLPAGEARSRTSAEYGEPHVERVRLVRALSEVGGLPLATVRRVLEVIDEPAPDHLDVLAAASRSLAGAEYVGVDDGGEPPPASRAREWLAARGWLVDPTDPAVDELDRAWAACEVAALGLDEGRMDRYADAAELVAAVDVGSVPGDPAGAVRQVVLGTVLVDPVVSALRRLAQQHVAVSGEGRRAAGDGAGAGPAAGSRGSGRGSTGR